MKKILLWILIVLLVGIWLFYISKSRHVQFFGWIITRAETDKSLVALTFDDGPTSWNLNRMRDILNKHSVKASFFLIWRDIELCRDCAQTLVRDGHQIGNHSYSHERMVFKTPAFVKNEIQKTDELIKQAGYSGETMFRTPYGKRLLLTTYYLRKYHKPNVFWDVEPETYVSGSGNILNYTLERVRSGSIILLHPWYWGDENDSIQILDELIIRLKERWFEFVTVDELMKQTDTKVRFW